MPLRVLVADDRAGMRGALAAYLRSLGVDVDPEVARVGAPAEIRIGPVQMVGPVPPMFYFRDPDGNALLIVQPG